MATFERFLPFLVLTYLILRRIFFSFPFFLHQQFLTPWRNIAGSFSFFLITPTVGTVPLSKCSRVFFLHISVSLDSKNGKTELPMVKTLQMLQKSKGQGRCSVLFLVRHQGEKKEIFRSFFNLCSSPDLFLGDFQTSFCGLTSLMSEVFINSTVSVMECVFNLNSSSNCFNL